MFTNFLTLGPQIIWIQNIHTRRSSLLCELFHEENLSFRYIAVKFNLYSTTSFVMNIVRLLRNYSFLYLDYFSTVPRPSVFCTITTHTFWTFQLHIKPNVFSVLTLNTMFIPFTR